MVASGSTRAIHPVRRLDPILSDISAPTAGDAATPAPVAHRHFAAERPLVCAVEAWGASRDPASGAPRVALHFVLKDALSRILAGRPRRRSRPTGRPTAAAHLDSDPRAAGRGIRGDADAEYRVAGKSEERRVTFVVEAAPRLRTTPPPLTPRRRPLGRGRPPPRARGPVRGRVRKTLQQRRRAGGLQAGVPARRRAARRSSHADLVFVKLPEALSWAMFPDVYEVDGTRCGTATPGSQSCSSNPPPPR